MHPSRGSVVGLLMAICFIHHFNRAAMSVAGTDRIIDQYRITPTQMGGVYTAFLVVYSLCMIPGGVFIDRFGAHRALLVVGIGSALFGALTGAAGWLFTTSASILIGLAIIRGLMGMVSAPMHPAAARSIAGWIPFDLRSRANGLVTMAAIGPKPKSNIFTVLLMIAAIAMGAGVVVLYMANTQMTGQSNPLHIEKPATAR